MADEMKNNEPAPDIDTVDVVAEPTGDLSEAVEQADPDDAVLLEALGDDGDSDDWDTDEPVDLEDTTQDKGAVEDTVDSNEASLRGLEVLIGERGFSPEQAQRMLAKDPEFVLEIGQAAIDAVVPDAEPGAEETPEAPEAESDTDTIAKISEILGQTFDTDESEAIAKAIQAATGRKGIPDIDKMIEERVGGSLKQITDAVAAQQRYLANQIARAEADKLADTHPEIKTEEGFAKVHAAAERLVKTGKFKGMGELMEAAATAVFGSTRQAEVKHYKDRVAKHRSNGAPTTPGQRSPASEQMDRDDLILHMSLKEGKTDTEIKDELARIARR